MTELLFLKHILQYKASFKEDGHVYKVKDRKVACVTDILKELGFIDTRWFKPGDANKGKRIHQITELFDRGILNRESLSEEQNKHLINWEKFLEEYEVEIYIAEAHLYHPYYFYGFTPDRIAKVKGKYAIIDLKTGAKIRWHRLQLLFYKSGIEAMVGESVKIYDVYTKTYKVEEIKDNDDVVDSVLKTWMWKNDSL